MTRLRISLLMVTRKTENTNKQPKQYHNFWTRACNPSLFSAQVGMERSMFGVDTSLMYFIYTMVRVDGRVWFACTWSSESIGHRLHVLQRHACCKMVNSLRYWVAGLSQCDDHSLDWRRVFRKNSLRADIDRHAALMQFTTTQTTLH